MQRSITNRTMKVLLVLALNILVGLGMMATAQNNSTSESRSVSVTTLEGGKVKIKIVTKRGDDQETFEKTYDNQADIQDDPELEKYGVDLDNFGFGSNGSFSFNSSGNSLFLNRGFRHPFSDDDDDHNNSIYFNFDTDSLDSRLRRHFRNFGGRNFHFGIDDDFDMDSLRKRFNFGFGNGFSFDIDSLRQGFSFGADDDAFWLNGEEFEDLESLREKLKEQFEDLDFDFGNWDDGGRAFNFSFGDDDGEDGFRIISRAKVFVRSAREADKEKVGADKMDELEIRDISFYPNPSDGRFTVDIRTGNENAIQVKIVNPDGAVVYDKSDQDRSGEYSFRVDLSGKQKGIYLLQVIQNNSSLTKRVIIE